jgi:hypothetical protein
MTTPKPIFRVRSDVVSTAVSESEAVLLSLDTSRYYSLNETGVAVWEALQNGASMSDLVAALCREFEVTTTEAESMLLEFLAELSTERLIEEERPRARDC